MNSRIEIASLWGREVDFENESAQLKYGIEYTSKCCLSMMSAQCHIDRAKCKS